MRSLPSPGRCLRLFLGVLTLLVAAPFMLLGVFWPRGAQIGGALATSAAALLSRQ